MVTACLTDSSASGFSTMRDLAVSRRRIFTQLALKRCRSLSSQPNWRTGPSIIHKKLLKLTRLPRVMYPLITSQPPNTSVISCRENEQPSSQGR